MSLSTWRTSLLEASLSAIQSATALTNVRESFSLSGTWPVNRSIPLSRNVVRDSQEAARVSAKSKRKAAPIEDMFVSAAEFTSQRHRTANKTSKGTRQKVPSPKSLSGSRGPATAKTSYHGWRNRDATGRDEPSESIPNKRSRRY